MDNLSPLALKRIPRLPGVYLMKDKAGTIIYIGKALSLRDRIRSYFSGADERFNVQFLMKKVVDIETIITTHERQALILEADLIKKHKPRYNIRLKDDKAHLIVRIDLNAEWPKIELVRKIYKDHAKYIGPFAYGHELKTMLDVIRDAIPLRTCSDRVMINRVRPCLEYQLKRCLAPCCLQIDRSEYLSLIKRAISILEGKNEDVVKQLTSEMTRASELLHFEDAANIRDQITVLQRITQAEKPVNFGPGSKDAIGLYRDGSKLEVSILAVRNGRLFGSRTYGFDECELPEDEVWQSVLSQLYLNNNDIPEEILLPTTIPDYEIREELLSERAEHAVKFVLPQRGDKQRLLVLAEENARENFVARFGADEQVEDLTLKTLKQELQLDEIPRTIECVDISHLQGSETVASIVFFKDGKPDTSRYRHMKLTIEGKADDFASMHEAVLRHLSRAAEENTLSDLMVIDGGIAQLEQALKARSELGLTTPKMIGLAKRRSIRLQYFAQGKEKGVFKPERIYREGNALPLILRESSKALHLLERLRDEAHRFAITFHRAKRSKRFLNSLLDDIPGVGNKTKLALLKNFESVKQISELSAEEIVQQVRISPIIAQRIIEVLNKRITSRNPRLI